MDKDGIYHIGTKTISISAGKMALATKIYPLTYANPLELTRIIRSAMTADGQVNTDVATNSLIITDIPTVLTELRK